MPRPRLILRTACLSGWMLAAMVWMPAQAQQTGLSASMADLPSGNTMGLSAPRLRTRPGCGIASLGCHVGEESVYLYTGTRVGAFWGAQLGLLDLNTLGRADGAVRGQGLNLSLFGRAPLWNSLGVFGKLGATYGRNEGMLAPGLGASMGGDAGVGLSWSAGVSYDFTPRLSAVLELDSHDLRYGPVARDPVRGASLGLQYRY